MYQVPIVYTDQKIVGAITLNSEMEKLLKEGVQFILSASVVETKYRTSVNIIGVTLTPVSAEEEK